MKFISLMLGIVFTLISLAELFTGFEWGYRFINALALASFYFYWWLSRPPKMILPLAQQRVMDETDAI